MLVWVRVGFSSNDNAQDIDATGRGRTNMVYDKIDALALCLVWSPQSSLKKSKHFFVVGVKAHTNLAT